MFLEVCQTWTLILCPWGLSNSITREKVGQNFFFIGKFAFFSKKCVFNNLLGHIETNSYFAQNLLTFCTFIRCLLTFVVFDATRKYGPQYFFHWKVCLFPRIFVFNNLLGVARKKWSYNFHSYFQITFWTLKKRPMRFVTLDNRRKKRPKLFVHWKFWLFLFKIFFSTIS